MSVIDSLRNPLENRNRSTSGFSISQFKAGIQSDSILMSSRHITSFTIPSGLSGSIDLETARKITMRCETSSLPGVSFATSEEIRRYGVGPAERKPYMPIFTPVSCTYIVDGKGIIHSFFYDWMNLIVGFDSSQGMSSINSFGNQPYELSYKDDYSCDVIIYVYNETDNKVMEVTLYKAYPISVDSSPLSWAGGEEFMTMNVTWEYIDWSAKYYDVASSADRNSLVEIVRRNINNIAGYDSILGGISRVTQSLGISNPVQGLIGRFGAASERITDIRNRVSGTVSTIKNVIRRLG